MPDRADKFDRDTLNPLLNPLLASHMGRWAEVYFTNPPEKREQAVSELLRELEQVAVPATASVQTVAGRNAKENTDTADSLQSSASRSEVVYTCGVCAYKNSDGHTFCGMCGAPLQIAPETDEPQVSEAEPILGQSWYERSLNHNSVEEMTGPAVNSEATHEPGNGLQASWLQPEINLPRRRVETETPAPHRYRLYIGAVLAVIVAAFGFGVWRGTPARSGASASSSTVAIPSAQPAPARPQPEVVTASPLPTATPAAPPVQKQAAASSLEGQAGGAQIAPQTVPVPSSSSTVGAGQNGEGELAIAEQYLNGTSGMTRDSGEAAQWLWKAVSKRNVEATLVLSDLYLKGDGVPKSCDQARLLLDAAARKGAPAAAERLRTLEASNCN